MANNIRIKRSAVPGKIPTTGDLALGELAVNTYEGKLFIKQDTTSTGGGESIVTVGDRGYTGSQGITGYTGSQGALGYTGSSGRINIQSSTPPTPLYEGQIWFDSNEIKTYVYFDSYWIEIGSSEIGTLYNRANFITTTNVLANNESQNITLPAYKSYVLLQISTSAAAWVRIYTDSASRTADASRLITQDPVAGSGVVSEIATSGAILQKITPFVFGGNLESPPTTDVFLTITNLSGISQAINIGLTLIRLEI